MVVILFNSSNFNLVHIIEIINIIDNKIDIIDINFIDNITATTSCKAAGRAPTTWPFGPGVGPTWPFGPGGVNIEYFSIFINYKF